MTVKIITAATIKITPRKILTVIRSRCLKKMKFNKSVKRGVELTIGPTKTTSPSLNAARAITCPSPPKTPPREKKTKPFSIF